MRYSKQTTRVHHVRCFASLLLLLLLSLLAMVVTTQITALAIPASASPSHHSNQTPQSQVGGIPFYGKLDIPTSYFHHRSSHDPINFVQPGSVILVNGEQTLSVPVQRDGSFVIYHLPFGTYLLQADYHDFIFPSVRVSVQYKEREGNILAVIRTVTNEFPEEPLHGSGTDESSPAIIPIMGMHNYYVPREEFSLMSIIKNPMVLMLLMSLGMFALKSMMPEEDVKESERMTRNLGKKLMAKAAERQKTSQSAQITNK